CRRSVAGRACRRGHQTKKRGFQRGRAWPRDQRKRGGSHGVIRDQVSLERNFAMKHRLWKYAALVLASLGSALLVKVSEADSLWDNRDHRSAYLFVDNRARRVGDLLTVTVREVTGAKNNEERKLEKDTAASGKFNFSGKTSANGNGNDAAAELSSSQA